MLSCRMLYNGLDSHACMMSTPRRNRRLSRMAASPCRRSPPRPSAPLWWRFVSAMSLSPPPPPLAAARSSPSFLGRVPNCRRELPSDCRMPKGLFASWPSLRLSSPDTCSSTGLAARGSGECTPVSMALGFMSALRRDTGSGPALDSAAAPLAPSQLASSLAAKELSPGKAHSRRLWSSSMPEPPPSTRPSWRKRMTVRSPP
mmetsp:Transcript_23853/g.75080  ORF Transcript_23853/g.75080 Transcript_23853/m.75080 type:complete len:202 (-) Transcript_23853:838-1443(-)